MLTPLRKPYTLTGTLTPPDHHITAGASADSVIVGLSEAQPWRVRRPHPLAF